jgi:hypothetical protein
MLWTSLNGLVCTNFIRTSLKNHFRWCVTNSRTSVPACHHNVGLGRPTYLVFKQIPRLTRKTGTSHTRRSTD